MLDRARVKDKDRLALIDILDIKAGQASAPLRRSGRPQHAERYLSFTAEERTFDVEAPSAEGRDWLFKKFADLFQAYATAKIEGQQGDNITLRVSELMDGGKKAAAAEDSPRRRSAGRDDFVSRSPRSATLGRAAGAGAAGVGGDGGAYYGDDALGRRRTAQPGRMRAPSTRGGGGYNY